MYTESENFYLRVSKSYIHVHMESENFYLRVSKSNIHVYGVREFLLSVNTNVHHRARHLHRFLANFQTRIKLLNDKQAYKLTAGLSI